MTTDPRAVFPGFYGNAAIRQLARSSRWTVSTRDKVPLDVRKLISGDPEISGAFEPTPQYLVTLDELAAAIPGAVNNAFYIDVFEDDLIVLDIEPSCPEDLRSHLLRLPALYRETSMSGRGYHLVLPVPTEALDRPFAIEQCVIRDSRSSKAFELLQRHYVTFTRNVVAAPTEGLLPMQAWGELYAELADLIPVERRVRDQQVAVAITEDIPDHPANAMLLRELTNDQMKASLRPLSDFDGDHSGFEFSALGVLLTRLRLLKTVNNIGLEPGHDAWLIYRALTVLIPRRPKHAQLRGSRPLLLDRAALIVAQPRS